MDSLTSQFEQPPVQFRPVPFWSWNDKLDPEELRRQIRLMGEAGMGGAFMHARLGLETPYLGDEWMECVKASMEEFSSQGMQAWLYDEDRWPSGDCSKRVMAENPDFRQKTLEYHLLDRDELEWTDDTVAVYVAAVEDGIVYDAVRVDSLEELDQYEVDQVLKITVEHHDYVDVFNAEATRRFIELTHEAYAARFGEAFADGRIPGIFTDEPQYGFPAWSAELPKRFKADNGYALLDKLPMLFFDMDKCERFRHDYFKTLTNLFVDSWTKPVAQWCSEHNLTLTGHMNNDHALLAQTGKGGVGDAMAHLEQFQMPGIDHLGRCISDPVLPRQASSVARQTGRDTVLSEMFGCSGWNVSFDHLRWIAAWQFMHGVNRVCPHLAAYSLRGCRKRDYPPSLHYHQPWWPHARMLNDTLARMLVMATQGMARARVLVLSPLTTVWTLFSPRKNTAAADVSNKFAALCQTLAELHVGYDIGDELLLAQRGKVEGDKLVMGECTYDEIVLPNMLNLELETWEMLKAFQEGGGKLLCVASTPTMLGGKTSKPVREWGKGLERVADPTAKVGLKKKLEPEVTICDEWEKDTDSILLHARHLDDGRRIFMMMNSDQHSGAKTFLHIPGAGSVERWNPEDASIADVPVKIVDDHTVAPLAFQPMEPMIMVFDPNGAPTERTEREPETIDTVELTDQWIVEPEGYNVLTLDYAQYRVDGGEWEDMFPVVEITREVAALGRDCDVELMFAFEVDADIPADRELFLVMEEPSQYGIALNDREVPNTDKGDWYDRAFRKVDISGRLVRGKNVLVLKRRFTSDDALREMSEDARQDNVVGRVRFPTEFEAVHIVGDFLVAASEALHRQDVPAQGGTTGNYVLVSSGEFRIAEEIPWRHTTGDLVSSGYPFYSGRAVLKQTVTVAEKPTTAQLHIDPPNAVIVALKVNGKDCGVRAWHPWSFDVTEAIEPGDNTVEFELTGSLRNTLGPLHLDIGESYWVSPHSFTEYISAATDSNVNWTDDICLVPFGLEGKATLTLTTRIETTEVEGDIGEEEQDEEAMAAAESDQEPTEQG